MVFNKQHGHDGLVKISAKFKSNNLIYNRLCPLTPPSPFNKLDKKMSYLLSLYHIPKFPLCLGAAASQFEPPAAIQVTITVIWSAVEI